MEGCPVCWAPRFKKEEQHVDVSKDGVDGDGSTGRVPVGHPNTSPYIMSPVSGGGGGGDAAPVRGPGGEGQEPKETAGGSAVESPFPLGFICIAIGSLVLTLAQENKGWKPFVMWAVMGIYAGLRETRLK